MGETLFPLLLVEGETKLELICNETWHQKGGNPIWKSQVSKKGGVVRMGYRFGARNGTVSRLLNHKTNRRTRDGMSSVVLNRNGVAGHAWQTYGGYLGVSKKARFVSSLSNKTKGGTPVKSEPSCPFLLVLSPPLCFEPSFQGHEGAGDTKGGAGETWGGAQGRWPPFVWLNWDLGRVIFSPSQRNGWRR